MGCDTGAAGTAPALVDAFCWVLFHRRDAEGAERIIFPFAVLSRAKGK
jgi:hypothetical protein